MNEKRSTNKYTQDPRVNQFITWALTAFCGVSLSIGAWFFSGLQTNMDKLKDSIVELRLEVSKLEFQAKAIDKLTVELAMIKSEQSKRTGNVYKVQSLEERVKALEIKSK